MRLIIVSLMASATALIGCATASPPLSVDDVTGPARWGSADNVMHLSRLYISEQPDAAGLQAARQHGVTTVINLRAPGETTFDGAAAARDAGLNYYQVPVAATGQSFDRAAFERISTLVAAHPGEPILLHCSSGNRVGAWLAAHLVEDHGMTTEAALPIARRAGITREEVESRVRRYLDDAPMP